MKVGCACMSAGAYKVGQRLMQIVNGGAYDRTLVRIETPHLFSTSNSSFNEWCGEMAGMQRPSPAGCALYNLGSNHHGLFVSVSRVAIQLEYSNQSAEIDWRACKELHVEMSGLSRVSFAGSFQSWSLRVGEQLHSALRCQS